MTTVAGFVFVHDLVRITDDSAHHLSVRMTATPLSLLPLKNKKLSDWDVRVRTVRLISDVRVLHNNAKGAKQRHADGQMQRGGRKEIKDTRKHQSPQEVPFIVHDTSLLAHFFPIFHQLSFAQSALIATEALDKGLMISKETKTWKEYK